MRRTKIVCTLGPAVSSAEAILALAEAGMNVARINSAHGDWQTRHRWMEWIREAEKTVRRPIGVLLDLSGPKVRLGELKEPLEVQEGQTLRLQPDTHGGDSWLPLPVPEVFEVARPDDRILVDDGSVELCVVDLAPDALIVKVVEGGTIRSHRGVTLLNRSLPLPSMTPRDEADLREGIEADVNWVALSFVRSPADLYTLRARLRSLNAEKIPIIAKIEQKAALQELDEIIGASDGIMVARGDLGLQVELSDVPILQKRIIQACNKAVKPVITATQMLESMMTNGRPTRAEVTDVANAILDGTDAIMLSGETAIGQFPVQSVKWMARIAERAEEELDFKRAMTALPDLDEGDATEAVAYAACAIAHTLDVSAILTATTSGGSARWVSHFRPKPPILAITSNEITYRKLTLYWGVTPMQVQPVNSTDEMSEAALTAALRAKLVKTGDQVVLTAGVPVNVPGNTNMIQVLTVE
jgi:pyruvate kinase